MDGDGENNGAEYTAGTDPNDAVANFLVSFGSKPGELSWLSAPARSYTIWRSPDLATWEPVASGLPSAGSFTSWTDPAPSGARAFYKVEAHHGR